jgi:hypothetical protein
VADLWPDVEQAVLAGDVDRVVGLCLGLDEQARAALAEPAKTLARQHRYPMDSPVVQAAQTALLSVGPPPPIERGERDLFRHPAHQHLEAVVLSRPRAWRDAWAQAAVGHAHWASAPTWATLRALLRAGACTRPEGDGYPWLLLHAMQCLADGVACKAGDVATALRDDPEVLEQDIWAAFRIAADNSWLFDALQRALVELAGDGSIERGTLVDETLVAIARTDDPGTGRRVMAFHDRVLKPTPAELADRQQTYLRWLDSDRDALVGFGLANIARLGRRADLDGRDLLERLGPLVALRSKAHAKRAVVLAERVVEQAPGLAATGLSIVADALAHDSAEVQDAALGVLERHGAVIDPVALRAFVDVVDPGLAERLSRLAGTSTSVERSPAAVAVPPASIVDPDRVPRLLPVLAIEPVADVEELVELAARLLEGLDDADEAERFVGGVSRLCGHDVPSGRRTAVLRRAKRRNDPIAVLVRAWLGWDGEHPPSIGWTGPTEGLGRRLTAVARRIVDGREYVLLSAPTHRGGFVDPVVLANRLERTEFVDDHDLAQALLRLPVQERATGLQAVAAGAGEPARIAEALLAGRVQAPADATLPAAWDSAVVIAAPDQVVLEVRAPEDPWHGYSYGPGTPCSPARHLAAFEPLTAVSSADGRLLQRWLATVWPCRRDLYFGTVLRTLRSWWRSVVNTRQRQDRLLAAFDVMRQLDEPLGPYALELLALGVLASDDNRLAAAEVVADAIATRRLDPGALGRAIAFEAVRPDAVPNRVGTTLRDVADLGALHALEVQQVLEATLAGLGDHQPSMVAAVDLLRRLSVEADARVSNEAARAWLDRLAPSSKSGRLARSALAVAGDGAARSVEAAAAVGEAQRERAARWAVAAAQTVDA